MLREKGLLSASDEFGDFCRHVFWNPPLGGDPIHLSATFWFPCSGSTQIHHACLRSGVVVSPPFGDWDSEWLHCSDVEFLDFLVWLLVVGRVKLVLLYASKLTASASLPTVWSA